MSTTLGSYERLEVWRDGHVGWLVFDRPDAGNALDATMFRELEQAWLELDADPEVRVIVNTGNGAAFQTGLDVVQVAKDKDALRTVSRQTRDFELRFTSWQVGVRKPVIAAVNGICAGGGLHFVADSDIVIASSTATFTDPHVSIGQVSAFETIALIRRSPMESILRMAFTGRHERMPAARAYQLGIISQVVDRPEDLRAEAGALAEKIARNSPTAMAVTKKALWEALERDLTDACAAGAKDLAIMWGHPDQEEGPAAFAEKRAPAWTPLDHGLLDAPREVIQ
ncbi:MAG: enoyl-CoA hydratase/isomerase family protein [Acidimicrobiia bacterium]|jgi:enoyl-CoA hydratase/carnithine racemase